jgi:hypothetical protein
MVSGALRSFIDKALSDEDWKLKSIDNGANNRGYKLDTKDRSYFLKCFAPCASAASKLKQEYEFSRILFDAGIIQIAEPVSYDIDALAAVYSFIEGSPFSAVQEKDVDDAVKFIQAINSPGVVSQDMPFATESPINFRSFVDIMEQRLGLLHKFCRYDSAITGLVSEVASRCASIASDHRVCWETALPRTIVSPSDFGFHNALKGCQSSHFIDFEYAGLDSPWKLICDFFSQPSVPVPLSYVKKFLDLEMFKEQTDSVYTLIRLFELTQLKWCLIMLNEFLPEIQARRIYALGDCANNDEMSNLIKAMQSKQLIKSERYFSKIDDMIEQFHCGIRS